MKDFVKTQPGRLLVFGLGLALAGGGAATLFGEPYATWLLAGVFPVTLALSVVAIALASNDHWGYAVASVIGLPFLALLYAPALGVAIERGSWVGFPLIVIGAGALALGVRPGAAGREREQLREVPVVTAHRN